MKTAVVKVANPTPGDLVIVQYLDDRGGGRTHVMHKIGSIPGNAETPQLISGLLAKDINGNWMKESFEARVNDKGDLIVNCANSVPYVKFSAYVEGEGGTTVDVTEF